jgi:hypothetical protein
LLQLYAADVAWWAVVLWSSSQELHDRLIKIEKRNRKGKTNNKGAVKQTKEKKKKGEGFKTQHKPRTVP